MLSAISAAMAAQDGPRTLSLAVDMVRQYPDFQEGLSLFAEIMLQVGQARQALMAARRAVSIDESNLRAWMVLGRICATSGRQTEALTAVGRARALQAVDANETSTLASLCFDLGQQDAALELHRDAVARDPENAEYQYHLAVCLQSTGDIDAAEKTFQRVLEQDPEHAAAYYHLSRLKKQRPEQNHIKSLRQLIERRGAGDDRIRLRYALAKELEDIGEFDESFEVLAKASSEHRSLKPYDVRHDLRFFSALKQAFPVGMFDGASAGHDSAEPLFVVGLPRSGTTLVEQILAAHSEVYAAGELRDFPSNLSLQISASDPVDRMTPQQLRDILATNPAALGKRYIEQTRPRTGHTPHFVDKLPRNSHLAGYIHWALPNARIVLLERDPVDVCLSNFKVLFDRGYEYSYDLGDLAEYWIGYRQLMDHWIGLLPAERLYRLSYEALVADQEAETRRLLEFCELDFQPACLDFFRNSSAVTTASVSEVRQPMYKTAVRPLAKLRAPAATVAATAGRGRTQVTTEKRLVGAGVRVPAFSQECQQDRLNRDMTVDVLPRLVGCMRILRASAATHGQCRNTQGHRNVCVR